MREGRKEKEKEKQTTKMGGANLGFLSIQRFEALSGRNFVDAIISPGLPHLPDFSPLFSQPYLKKSWIGDSGIVGGEREKWNFQVE